jgi:hypothetical protein
METLSQATVVLVYIGYLIVLVYTNVRSVSSNFWANRTTLSSIHASGGV